MRVTAYAGKEHSAGIANRATDPAALGGYPKPPFLRVTARAEQSHSAGIAYRATGQPELPAGATGCALFIK